MSAYRVASRYAKSLLELALEQKSLDEVFNSLSLVDRTFAGSPDLGRMLQNPVVRYDYKLRILTRVFGTKTDPLTLRFFELLCRKGRADLLPEVCRVFTGLYYEHKGMVTARVKTAVALDGQLREELTDYVKRQTGKEVKLEEQIEPDLIGGFVLNIEDRQLDASVSGMLRQLKKELYGKK
jgi:F-type H+-transporting ATPase subunit delta